MTKKKEPSPCLIIGFIVSIILIHNTERGFAKPNILIFLTDDLDSELGGVTPLVKTTKWIRERGRNYQNAFATTPICCPSRSSILTGLYQYNTNVYNNSLAGNCANQKWQVGPETQTFATYAKKRNYTTAYIGKYLNQYGFTKKNPLRVPVGWDFWAGLVGNSRYYNYSLSVNGKRETHGNNYENDYLTDIIQRKAIHFLEDHFQSMSQDPFLMVLATPSPHAPFTPAPQYKDRFPNLKAPRTPHFNYVNDTKHWFLRTKPLNDELIDVIDEAFRNRWRTLLSVDDLVDNVMKTLTKQGLLNNTYVIFTSDHGYHLGQYGMVLDKRLPYETDIRVPFFLSGPDIPPGEVSKDIALNIDIAPTILDMMGVAEDEYDWMDGFSLMKQKNRTKFAVEYHGQHGGGIDPGCDIMDKSMDECSILYGCRCQDTKNNTYFCNRRLSPTINFIHCWFKDNENFQEIYDMKKDPFELNNLYTSKFF